MVTAHAAEIVNGFRRIFYMVSPNETSYEKVEELPNYVSQAVVYFTALIVIETLVLHAQGKHGKALRINDAITSCTGGIIFELKSIFLTRSMEGFMYIYIWENYRLCNLPWDSAWTWVTAAVGVDFAYYWFHRAAHEVNIMWAAHQMHHSSEDYNLTTALRQSPVQRWFSLVTYLPLALFVPPTHYLMHFQFSLMYQFWYHTQAIKSLGPLEYVLVTPSHHRVHHGANKYCIDKNYGAALIIWDRIFGTFEAEKEEVAYGLTTPVASFNPLYIQYLHFKTIYDKVCSASSLSDKLKWMFYGPGWEPGKPRLGDPKDLPDIRAPIKKFDPVVPAHVSLYCGAHFLLLVYGYQMMAFIQDISTLEMLLYAFTITMSFVSIGGLLENRFWAPHVETVRCVLILAVYYMRVATPHRNIITALFHVVYFSSALVWAIFQCLRCLLHMVNVGIKSKTS